MRFLYRFQLLFEASQNERLVALLGEQCRRDIFFWFDQFAWTFDPRKSPPHRAFVLYGYQRAYVKALCNAIDGGHDLLIEKSRDMGISWLTLLVFQYYWLYREGSHFHLGSRKLEYVDRKGDVSTLFEKLRYNLDWLPDWMKPAGFNARLHDSQFRLINPANGNQITGESSNANFARGGRYKAILFDEFPFWQDADASYASAGQSSPARIVVGTPYGKNNKFAELRFGGQIAVTHIHWRAHPEKDEAWYDAQRERMSVDEIARELDVNYHLSIRDRVFTDFSSGLHVRELEPLVGRAIVRVWDFGYHCPACLFLQVDGDGIVRVLLEVLGERELLAGFAGRVLAIAKARFGEVVYEDYCDPAGAQRSDKNVQTSIDILNSLGVYPFYDRASIRDGIELIRMKLVERVNDLPGLLVSPACEKLIEAFEGGYRFANGQQETPLQEHPYEDVMDCLRYAVAHKCGLMTRNKKQARRYKAGDRYTGY